MKDHSPFGVNSQVEAIRVIVCEICDASIVVYFVEVWIIHIINHLVVRIGATKETPIAHHECSGDDKSNT